MPCAANVEGDREAGARENRGQKRAGEGIYTPGREAGAETEKALVCYFLELIIQSKTCTQQSFF